MKAKVVEIGPRDGFQNVKEFIPTETKLKIIDGMVQAGFKKIQITSFVSPKAIPQMKDAKEVAEQVLSKYSGIDFFALVPNLYGAKNAVACVFGCPFEGEMSVDALVELIGKLKDIGVDAFTLCDTIGVAYPTLLQKVFKTVKEAFPGTEFNAHIHDTRNMGILNSYIALQSGADSVQAAIGGLGGCPFAPGATGNTSSEDLVYMLNKCGYDTGVDFDILLKTAKYAKQEIDGNFSGHHINISEHPCVITQE